MNRDFSAAYWSASEPDQPQRPGPERNPAGSFADFAAQGTTSASGNAAAAAPAPISPNSREQAFEQEKRRHPRFKCEGALELKTEGSTIRTWATFTDLSITGCYMEMMTTFPVGTKTELQLGMNGFLVSGAAVVRATYPFLGMGIEFTNLSPNAREQLQAMVNSLTNLRIQRPVEAAREGLNLPPITEPQAAIDALVQHFAKNATLSAEEFDRLVSGMQQRSS